MNESEVPQVEPTVPQDDVVGTHDYESDVTTVSIEDLHDYIVDRIHPLAGAEEFVRRLEIVSSEPDDDELGLELMNDWLRRTQLLDRIYHEFFEQYC